MIGGRGVVCQHELRLVCQPPLYERLNPGLCEASPRPWGLPLPLNQVVD